MIPAYDLKKPRQPGKPPSVTSDFCVCLSMEDNRSMGGQNTLMSKYKIQLYFSILYLVFCKVFCLPLQSISIIRGSFNLIKLYSRKNISKKRIDNMENNMEKIRVSEQHLVCSTDVFRSYKFS
jgi:hypothetical protein